MKEVEKDFPDSEISHRRDDAIRRALNTPPKPHKGPVVKGDPAKGPPKSLVKKAGRSKPARI